MSKICSTVGVLATALIKTRCKYASIQQQTISYTFCFTILLFLYSCYISELIANYKSAKTTPSTMQVSLFAILSIDSLLLPNNHIQFTSSIHCKTANKKHILFCAHAGPDIYSPVWEIIHKADFICVVTALIYGLIKYTFMALQVQAGYAVLGSGVYFMNCIEIIRQSEVTKMCPEFLAPIKLADIWGITRLSLLALTTSVFKRR